LLFDDTVHRQVADAECGHVARPLVGFRGMLSGTVCAGKPVLPPCASRAAELQGFTDREK
jgi:hypothetical protein